MKCPVCKGDAGGYYWPVALDPPIITEGSCYAGGREWENMPLYQRSFPGEPEYISPRCVRCFDKAVKKEERKRTRRNTIEKYAG